MATWTVVDYDVYYNVVMFTPTSIAPTMTGKPAGSGTTSFRTTGPKKTKGRRPPMNGVSFEGSGKQTVRSTGKAGFSQVGAAMSGRGR